MGAFSAERLTSGMPLSWRRTDISAAMTSISSEEDDQTLTVDHFAERQPATAPIPPAIAKTTAQRHFTVPARA